LTRSLELPFCSLDGPGILWLLLCSYDEEAVFFEGSVRGSKREYLLKQLKEVRGTR